MAGAVSNTCTEQLLAHHRRFRKAEMGAAKRLQTNGAISEPAWSTTPRGCFRWVLFPDCGLQALLPVVTRSHKAGPLSFASWSRQRPFGR